MVLDVDVNTIFQPKQAIRKENQEHFIGREDAIRKALITINSGSTLAIIGERGIGKTSLAWQLMEVFAGNYELLDRNGIKPAVQLSPQNCVWIECTKQLENTEGLIIQLLSQKVQEARERTEISIPSLFKEALQSEQVERRLTEIVSSEDLESFSERVGTDVDQDAVEQASNLDNMLTKIVGERRRLHTLFKDVLDTIKRLNEDRSPIIFIDEIDTLPDKSGIADLLKSINSAQLVLVGVANNINEIVSGHLSAERKFIGSTLNLDRFQDDDIEKIFDRAEEKLSSYEVTFSREFRDLVADYSDGFPFMIHAFGMNALTIKLTEVDIELNPGITFTEDDFKLALEEVTSRDIDMHYRYNRLDNYVNNSGKEAILFLLSEKKGFIEEDELLQQNTRYRFLPNLKELASPMELDGSEQPPIIIRQNQKVRFIDPIMRTIVKDKLQKGEKLYEKKR